MKKVDPTHEANQIHSSYVSAAKARNLSVAYGHRADWFRLDSRIQRRWVYPAPNECLSASDVSYLRGMSRFDWRVGKENWTTSNVFDRTLNTSAATPFTHKLSIDNWPPKTEALLNGEGAGLDAEGNGLKRLHQQAFGSKFKPGIHFIRILNLESGPVWSHVKADAMLNWKFKLVKDVGVVITEALVENIQESGHLVRTIYRLESNDVIWKSYVSIKTVGDEYIIYAPRAIKDMQFEWEVLKEGKNSKPVEGRYKGLGAVPIAPFYTDWEVKMQSPPLFAEAADLQLKVDNRNSHLNDFVLRVLASPVFVTVNADEEDDNGIVPPASSKGSGLDLPQDSSASWQALKGSAEIDEIARRIIEDEKRIELMCLSSLETEYQGDKRVLETTVREGRSVTVLEALMLSDIPSLDKLARFTAHLLGETVPNDAKITASRVKREGDKKDLIERAAKWLELDLIPKEVFYKIWKENSEDISDKLWEELQPLLDTRIALDADIEVKEKEVRDKAQVKVSGSMDLDAGE